MRAAWYERNGAASDVLAVGERPDPEPGAGEVRVRVAAAGINPADVKRRSGAGGRAMGDPLVIPGDDGAGVIDRVGPGVPAGRAGERVWVHSANHGQPFGTAAEFVVVPAGRAIPLPPDCSFEEGACLGVPALTAHRSVFADGPVRGKIVLVTGGAGAVSQYAIQLAVHGGANVIATASTSGKQRAAADAGASRVIDYRQPGVAQDILRHAPGGVDRVVDVGFGVNLPLTSAVIAPNGVIATYGSDAVPVPEFPFYPLMRKGVTVRTVSVFIMPPDAMRAAVSEIGALLAQGALTHRIAVQYPLGAIAAAHQYVESGLGIGKTVLTIQAL